MLCIHTGSYFRKYIIHLGVGVVYLASMGGGLGVAYRQHRLLKSAKIYSNPAKSC